MTETVWLDSVDALGIHDMMLAHHGGLAGVRDEGLLESALARPRNHHAYGQESMHVLAAMYAAGTIRNHPFVDGNKRTGFMLAATFLEINGWEFVATEESVVERTFGLAAGEVSEDEYAAWMKANSRTAAET